jgi:electron transfer flavoprotein alpha subunit
MANVLVVAEFGEGTLKRTTHSAITFAQQVVAAAGGGFDILVLGQGLDAAAAELAKFGAGKVLVADDAKLAQYTAERFAPTVAAAAAGHDVVVAAASAFGKDLLPRLAGKLDAGYAADITEVRAEGGKLLYKRPMFAGNAYGICQIESAVQLVTVRQSSFAPAAPGGGGSAIEKVAAAAPSAGADRIEWVELKQVKNERPELTEADVVVSGGRGCKEKFHAILDPLADALGAAIGATRAACDAEWAGSDLQVG